MKINTIFNSTYAEKLHQAECDLNSTIISTESNPIHLFPFIIDSEYKKAT